MTDDPQLPTRKRRKRGLAARAMSGVASILGHFFGAMPPPHEQETSWVDLDHNRSIDRSPKPEAPDLDQAGAPRD